MANECSSQGLFTGLEAPLGLMNPDSIPVMIYLCYPDGNGNTQYSCINYLVKLGSIIGE